MKKIITTLFFMICIGSVGIAQTAPPYTTNFNLTESPISEGGKWHKNGLDWTNVVTSDGVAYGTQTGGGGFDDSYALLTGNFPADQSVSAVIHLESGIAASYAEVELLLRWRDSDHNSVGYECNLAHDGQYAEIIKWPGPLGTDKSQFNFISSGNPVSGGVHDGDIFQADVIGNVITVRLNGKVIASGTDNSIPNGGAPGMGFYSEGAPASKKYSFTQFSWLGMPSTNTPPAITVSALANPNPATTTTNLSVVATDDGGAANLSYAWSVTGIPPAPVSFSVNNSNAAKNTTATFTQSGQYTLAVTITDQGNLSVVSSVVVNVSIPVAVTGVSVSPATTTLGVGNNQQLTASVLPSNATTKTVSWSSSNNAIATVNATGLVTAISAGSAVITVTTQDGGKTAVCSVTVSNTPPANTPPTITVSALANPNPATTTTNLSVAATDDGGAANLSYAWSVTGTSPAPVSFSINNSNAAKNTTATFTQSGQYTLAVTVTDQENLSVVSSVVVTVSPAGYVPPYTTNFDLTESPISEGGKWHKNGLDWTNVVTSDGVAYGTQTGTGGFNDSYSLLTGNFPADQSVSAVIHLESGIAASYAEVELLLRWRDSDHNSVGYECNLAHDGQYAEIVKWPGPLGTNGSQYTFISSGNPVSGGVHDGDIFQADVIGNVITVRLNGKVIASGTDNSIPNGGAPGMGFYSEGAPASKKYSFTQFSWLGNPSNPSARVASQPGITDQFIQEEVGEQSIVLYPNPSDAEFNFRVSSTEKEFDLSILNAEGIEIIKQKTLRSGELYRVGETLPTGLYFFMVDQKGSRKITKAMKGVR